METSNNKESNRVNNNCKSNNESVMGSNKKSKIVYVACTHRGRTTIWAGNVEELRSNNVFGYTLECGNSWNKKINREPKSVASLVTNLNNSVSETQGGRFDQDHYEIATKEQYDDQQSEKAPKKEEVNNQSNNSNDMATKKEKTVKVEDSKNEVKNLVDNFDAPAMDERILKLNELKAVKMANLSKGKRPAAKEVKELAIYILNNWDNEFELLKIEVAPVKIAEILASRLENLADAKKACEEAVEEIEKTFLDVNGVQIKVGDYLEDLTKGFEGQINEVIEDEGQLAVNVDGTTIYLNEIDNSTFSKIVSAPEKSEEKEEAKVAPAKSEKTSTKKEAKKADKKVEPKEKEAKTARKVGDVHPKHETWIWTEYSEGKFDWRTNPGDKKKVGAKSKSELTDDQKELIQKATKGGKAKVELQKGVGKANAKKNTKQSKKVETKKEPEEKKEFTLSDFIAMPKMRRGDKLSKAQEEALKLILKGYWIWDNVGSYFFKNEAGETKSCNMESVKAMFNKYGVHELPVDLVR